MSWKSAWDPIKSILYAHYSPRSELSYLKNFINTQTLPKLPIDFMSGNSCLTPVVRWEIYFHNALCSSVNGNLIWKQIAALPKEFVVSYMLSWELDLCSSLSRWQAACKGQWRTALWRKWIEHPSRASVCHSCLSGLAPALAQWLLQKGNLRGLSWGSEHGAEGHLLPKNHQSVICVYNYPSHPHAAGLLEHSIPWVSSTASWPSLLLSFLRIISTL